MLVRLAPAALLLSLLWVVRAGTFDRPVVSLDARSFDKEVLKEDVSCRPSALRATPLAWRSQRRDGLTDLSPGPVAPQKTSMVVFYAPWCVCYRAWAQPLAPSTPVG